MRRFYAEHRLAVWVCVLGVALLVLWVVVFVAGTGSVSGGSK